MTREAGGSVCRTSPKSMGASPGSGQVLTGGAGGVDAVTRASGELPLVDDEFAAREDRLDPAGGAFALVRRVVDVHVVGLGGHDLLGVRVVDDDVGGGARGDGALLRVQAEHAGRCRAGDLDPAAPRDVPVDDRLVEQVHTVLD